MYICKDVLIYIFEFLELKDFLSLFLVSKDFYDVSKKEYIWKIKLFKLIDKPLPIKKVKSRTPEYWIELIKKFKKKRYANSIYYEIIPFPNLYEEFLKEEFYFVKPRCCRDSLPVIVCKSFMEYYFIDNKLTCSDEDLKKFNDLFSKIYKKCFKNPNNKHFIYIFDDDYADWNVLFQKSHVFNNFIKEHFPYVFIYFNIINNKQ